MNDQNWLAAQFEANRSHLQLVAYRMLGSSAEAEDARRATARQPCTPQRAGAD